MSFENWLRTGNLIPHEATGVEIENLFGLADRELSDAAVAGLSDDGRFLHAYEAAFQLCTIALHACGYRVAKGKAHHANTVLSLELSLGPLQKDRSIYLSQCSTKRNHSLYDYAGAVEAADATELLEAARQLRADVMQWLRDQYPLLLPEK